MSKSRGNAVDPWAVIARHGVDAVRLFLIESSQVWISRRFDESVIRERAGRFLLTLKNVYSGIFAQYANFGWSPSALDPAPEQRPPIDRWVLSRLATVESQADALLDRYEATSAASLLMGFFVDDVANWYVRLSRSRFYEVDGEDNRAAFATLHEVLAVTCRLLAPIAPFVTDWVHRELTGRSVHLESYARDRRPRAQPDLERGMAAVQRLATLGRAAREEAGIKVRQPLSRLVCVVPEQAGFVLDGLVSLLASELNVKQVDFASSADSLVTLEARPNFRSLGKKFGSLTPLAAEAVKALDSEALRAFERGEPLAISVNNESRLLEREDLTIVRRASGSLVVSEAAGYFAAIDPVVTPALRSEGIAREIVSRVQRLRKEAGLAVSDRIVLAVEGDGEVSGAVREHRQWIADEVLARDIALGEIPGDHQALQEVDIDGLAVRIAITRVD
jgi:isoleucyl-tRNA synthetase